MGPMGLFRVILYACTPIALGKAAISGVHLIVASQNMASIDVNDRKKQIS
jgi:hypothetical protein